MSIFDDASCDGHFAVELDVFAEDGEEFEVVWRGDFEHGSDADRFSDPRIELCHEEFLNPPRETISLSSASENCSSSDWASF